MLSDSASMQRLARFGVNMAYAYGTWHLRSEQYWLYERGCQTRLIAAIGDVAGTAMLGVAGGM